MFLHRYSSILHLCVSQFEFVLGKAVPKMDMKQVNPPLAFLYSILYISFVTRPVIRGGARGAFAPSPQAPKARILILNMQVKECSRLN